MTIMSHFNHYISKLWNILLHSAFQRPRILERLRVGNITLNYDNLQSIFFLMLRLYAFLERQTFVFFHHLSLHPKKRLSICNPSKYQI